MKHILLSVCLVFLAYVSFAGDTIWYDMKWKKTDRINATYYRPAPQKKGNLYHIIDYYKDGVMQGDGWSYSDTAEIWEGRLNYYHRNGNVSSFVHYKNKMKNDSCKQFNPNGTLAGICFFVNDSLDGKFIQYYKNGTKQKELDYKNGKVNGIFKEFYESGNIKGIVKYKNDIIVDTAISYFENGTIQELMPFEQGVKTGTHIKYFENGKISETAEYKYGVSDGLALSYFENGKIKQSVALKNDVYEGPFKEYYASGKIAGILNYIHGKVEGKLIKYYEDGAVEREANYTNDKLNGPYKEFDRSGNMVIDCFYKDDKISDYCYELKYDYKGKLSSKTPYDYTVYIEDYIVKNVPNHRISINATPDRKLELKNKNGNISTTGALKNGQQDGLWKFYNDKGELLLSENYENGELNGERKLYNSKGAEIKKIPYKNGLLHGMIVEWDDAGEASLNMFYKNGKRIEDRKTFYKEFYSKGVTTKGNMQLINLDELKESDIIDDKVLVKEPGNPEQNEGDIKIKTIRETTYKNMDEMNEQEAVRKKKLIPMDTTYSKTDISAKIMILTGVMNKQTLETETKDFEDVLFTLEITNDGYYVMERPKSYKPKANEIAVFYEDNEGDFSAQQISASVGSKIKTAMNNNSFKPYRIIGLLDGGIFDAAKFPGMYVYDLIEEAAKGK
ncbi:MAG: hypothetical protein IPP60_15875 [Sphingobacteriales bacterium]|nr:hypothetical protein [Sphingobacteriales bacterium]